MSDTYARRLSRLPRVVREALRSGGPTQAQRELRPYIDVEREKRKKKSGLLTVVETFFDLLQRGQYASANTIQSLVDRGSFGDTSGAAWEGIKGKRKGTFKTTFFGGKDIGGEETKGLYKAFTGKATPKSLTKSLVKLPWKLGDISWADILGFAGDVIFDPTTYLTFGATRGAKFAADIFTEKKVALTALDLARKLPEIAQEGFRKAMLKEGSDAGVKYLGKHMAKKEIAQFFDKVVRETRRKALKMGPEAMEKELTAIAHPDSRAELTNQAQELY